MHTQGLQDPRGTAREMESSLLQLMVIIVIKWVMLSFVQMARLLFFFSIKPLFFNVSLLLLILRKESLLFWKVEMFYHCELLFSAILVVSKNVQSNSWPNSQSPCFTYKFVLQIARLRVVACCAVGYDSLKKVDWYDIILFNLFMTVKNSDGQIVLSSMCMTGEKIDSHNKCVVQFIHYPVLKTFFFKYDHMIQMLITMAMIMLRFHFVFIVYW